VKEQFNYARENLESIRKAAGVGQTAEDESLRSAIINHLFKFFKRMLFLGLSFFIFTLIYKTVRLYL
jgi:hypothetical protein